MKPKKLEDFSESELDNASTAITSPVNYSSFTLINLLPVNLEKKFG
jgi:hypothetical protein